MASARTVALGLAVGAIFALYLALWLHVLAFVALAAGASALVLILVLAAAFGEDAAAAQRDWRAAAGPIAGREPGEPSGHEPRSWAQPSASGESAGPRRPADA